MFTTKNLSRFVIILLMFVFCSVITETAFAMATDETDGAVLYVKVGGNGDCSTWEQACELQTALYIAVPGDQIWVAAGTYKPTTSSNREATFQMKSGVAFYGGFPADGGDWSSRDWETNTTTLSGDIGVNENITDNSYHVVISNYADNTAILDGFSVIKGNANSVDYGEYVGAGIKNIGGNPTFRNLTISDNYAKLGGGIYDQNSNPTLNNIEFSSNYAELRGGGMYNYSSSPILSEIIFSGNQANSGGGMYNEYNSSPSVTSFYFSSNTADSQGGGICNFSNSSPVLTNGNFFDNSAIRGGGIYNYNNSNTRLTYVTFSDNSATYGGGIYNTSASNPSLTSITFSNNSANDGGGMYSEASSPTLFNVSFNYNSGTGRGGGMFNYNNSNAIIINTTFASNSSNYGGGIHNDYSSPTLTNVTFRNNSATNKGGGIRNFLSHPTLTNITFSNNSADYGGGICNENDSNPSLASITFSNNLASYGGGLYNNNSNPTLSNVTFSTNSALYGGGLSNQSESNPSLLNVTITNNVASYNGSGLFSESGSNPILINSIVWGNSVDQITGNAEITYSDIEGGWTGEGNINLDPLLAPLTNNGGFTMTHALFFGSAAIDTGYIASCPDSDQRSFVRPIDGNGDGIEGCDMGAYEYGSYPATYAVNISIFGNGNVIKDPEKEFYDYGETVTLTAIADPGWAFGGWSGDVSGLENPLTLTTDRNFNIEATFTQNEYTLLVSINPPGQGTVTISPIKPFYNYGEVVTLTATPVPGWSFANWSGDVSRNENPLTIMITGNTEIIANFQRIKLYLPLISH